MSFLILLFGMMASANVNANELSVKFGSGGEGISKTFKEKDESPGFMSKGGKILCAVTYSKRPQKFNLTCKGNGMTSTMVIRCNGEAHTVFFNLEGEKDEFQVTGVCSNSDKT